ncbi:methylated-DNA--[protein]-cysteine S-methyltransferase [Umezawaea sp. Da 62-37]|uniref:methylated-DNA--[protein]-cysteine S-methyltransferase n=1 Tax=Umezawaea sp. Da 62-37 TaxID=3075927 RepID=UPI0028F70C82|nr:methylated-DNA--[protein]-cysteine S-methyltransferase [Umezawaea sp. Da 62-37]WNV88227.1 methylated-DNA--[protein]-cysteine S-methyltransferase [Umezawaea sp. Da 62-37]
MTATHTVLDSPIGDLTVVADDGVVIGLYFPQHWTRPDPGTFGERADEGFDTVATQLEEYFAGTRELFDLPTRADGNPFQLRVWEQIRQIPYGRTATYGALATALGDPSLARTVGTAVGSNPLSILTACHRVVGKNGALTGYAGGLERKQHLLDLEQPPPQERGLLW